MNEPDHHPTQLAFDEIVEDLLSQMTPKKRDTWKTVSRKDLILGHHTTGRAIRNYYRLWEEGNPTCDGKHPDDVSMAIMEAVWDRINVKQALSEMPESLNTSLANHR